MKTLFEFAGFLGVSVAAHLALWQGAPDGASTSAGAGGTASITLTGATRSLTALVSEWDRPPELPNEPTPVAHPAPDDVAPVLDSPQPFLRPTPPAPPMAPAMPVMVPQTPQVDRATPPPPRSDLAPTASPRPKPRPKPRRVKAEAIPDTIAKATPKPKRAASPPQTATGKGGKAAAGKAQNPGTGMKKAARPNASLMARWGGAIRARVERRKRFPSGASGNGKVGLWLKVTNNGQLAGTGLTRSSGNAAFDRAAINAVRRAVLPRAPGGIAPGAYRFTLSMSFNR